MIAVDLSNDVIIPSGVAIVGALVAGISAVLRSWFENKDARSRGDRKLDLAMRRTEFARSWIEISEKLDETTPHTDDTAPGPDTPIPESKAELVKRARKELLESAEETEIAFYDATTDTSTGLGQLRRLLMLQRRRSLASYVVSALFLYLSVFVWLLVCIPTPGDDGYSIPAAIFISIVATFVLRVLAGLVVAGLERHATSPHEKIADVAVSEGVVTVTTEDEHGFEPDQHVLIDASNDKFDGTFKVRDVPDASSFTFKMRTANAASIPGVTGWVSGDSVKSQIKRLFMIEGGHRRSTYVVSGLFLASIVGISIGAVAAADRYDTEQHNVCVGDPYDGTYFGTSDPLFDPDDAANFIRFEAPPWSTKFLTFTIVETSENRENSFFESDYLRDQAAGETDDWKSWTLVDSNGDKYTLDAFGLRYEDKSTVLYRRIGDSGLKKIGDPCAPQRLDVTITDLNDSGTAAEGTGSVLFEFYDDSANGDSSIVSLRTGDDQGTHKQIKAYFGRDGRLIPVCDDVRYPEIYPCLEPTDAYYDSGLDAAVTRAFLVGLAIFLGAIVSRLIFGWIAKLLEPSEHPKRDMPAVT
jgi:hypothetical protein